MNQELTFEQRLEDVQLIIQNIESGQMPLEESVRQYETGMRSLAALEKELQELQRRIMILQEKEDGTANEVPMEESE